MNYPDTWPQPSDPQILFQLGCEALLDNPGCTGHDPQHWARMQSLVAAKLFAAQRSGPHGTLFTRTLLGHWVNEALTASAASTTSSALDHHPV